MPGCHSDPNTTALTQTVLCSSGVHITKTTSLTTSLGDNLSRGQGLNWPRRLNSPYLHWLRYKVLGRAQGNPARAQATLHLSQLRSPAQMSPMGRTELQRASLALHAQEGASHKQECMHGRLVGLCPVQLGTGDHLGASLILRITHAALCFLTSFHKRLC